MSPVSASSGVWQHFTKSTDKSRAKCNKCGKDFSNPSTSTLRYHLTKTHLISTVPVARKTNQPPVEENDVDVDNDLLDLTEIRPTTPGDAGQNFATGSSAVSAEAGAGAAKKKNSVQAGPLDTCFLNAQAFARNGPSYKHATDALMFMIAHDDMPLCSTERLGLKVYTKSLRSAYKMPSEPTLTKNLEAKYELLKRKYGAMLAAADFMSLTADIWTDSKNMQSYLGLTAHFRRGTTMVNVELGVRFMPERKTTENLRQGLRELCAEWQINKEKVEGVVTDGGSNIKAAVREEFGVEKHISCIAHLMNIVGQTALGSTVTPVPSEQLPSDVVEVPENEEEAEALLDEAEEAESAPLPDDRTTLTSVRPLLLNVKRIVRFFKTSDVATTALKEAQVKNGRNPSQTLKLIQSVRTRWNSEFYMLDRYLELDEEVTTVLSNLHRERRSTKSKPPPIISRDDVEILTEVRDLLKPLEEATKMVCKEKAVTLSNVIPIVFGLKQGIEAFLPSHGVVFNLKAAILRELDKRFSGVEFLRPYAAATLLDPRYKKYVFQDSRAVANIMSHLGGRIAEKINDGRQRAQLEEEAAAQAAQPGPSSGIWAAVDERLRQTCATAGSVEHEPSGLPSQLKAYLHAPTVDRHRNKNPLEVWKSMRPGLEHVYDIAMEYLPIMASSVASERLFSHAGMIATQRRNRLSAKHLNMLVFLRSVPEELWFEN